MPLFRGNRDRSLLRLVAAIYESALNPARWQVFVDLLGHELNGIKPLYYVADSKKAVMEALLFTEDWGSDFLDPYLEHYNAINPWTQSLARFPTIGQPVSGNELIAESDLKKTEFFNEFFKRYWKWSSVCGTINYRDANAFSVFGLHCEPDRFEKQHEEMCWLSAAISPHITRAFEISRQLHHGRVSSASIELMLDQLHSPGLIISAGFRVRYANAPAEAMFTSGVLGLDSQACIVAGSRGRETNSLRTALAAALGSAEIVCGSSTIRLTRPLADENADALPLLVRILPLTAKRTSIDQTPPVPHLLPKPEALMLVADPAANRPLRARRLRQVFGLTPSETRLAQALAQGISVQGYAQGAGIAEGTARIQLKSVFSKTSTHRQAELVALLARLADPFKLGD